MAIQVVYATFVDYGDGIHDLVGIYRTRESARSAAINEVRNYVDLPNLDDFMSYAGFDDEEAFFEEVLNYFDYDNMLGIQIEEHVVHD